MTTRAGAPALTREDVLAIIARRQLDVHDSAADALRSAIDRVYDAVGYVDLAEDGAYDFGDPADGFLSDVWADLRPSEQADLARILTTAKAEAFAACRATIVEGAAAAALAFADAHPDAPRAVPA